MSHSKVASFRLQVFNSDGSEAEISGNGLRLAVKYALDRGFISVKQGEVTAETVAGVRTVWPTVENGRMVGGRIRMGVPRFVSIDFPSVQRGELRYLDLPNRMLPITCVSIGNPHAVAVIEQPVADFPLEEVGPLVKSYSLFPNRINFEIVNIIDSSRIRARIFERGEGETASSGTGSTAAAVVCRLRNHVGPQIDVDCVGGRLRVEWPGSGNAYLSGPTEDVSDGIWDSDSGSVTWLVEIVA